MKIEAPPYNITNNMLNLISEISEKVGKITSYKSLETKPHLRRNNRIKSIHSSLKIEANSLSLSNVRDVINEHQVIGDTKEIQEVKNANEAYKQLTKINPYDKTQLLKSHYTLTKHTINQSGQFRTGEEGVFSGDKCIFVAPPAKLVNGLMENLMNWANNNISNIHPLILSSVFHYELIFIHPFTDGNGRMARLWQSVILYNWNRVFEYIPVESQIEKFQNEYYDSISVSHTEGNSDPFINFMLKAINEVLDDVILQINKENASLSSYVSKMLELMEYDIQYSSKQIVEMLGLKSKENLRKNYINPAIELGLIEMTIPDKPRSKNQRYVKR